MMKNPYTFDSGSINALPRNIPDSGINLVPRMFTPVSVPMLVRTIK